MKKYINLKSYGANQKLRKQFYTVDSITHPAKMDIPLCCWILEHYINDGEIILDPMCGIGTTLIEGMRMFPKSIFIGVEFEDKFVKMAQANIHKIRRVAKEDLFMKIGKAICIQGDARSLKGTIDKVLFSPPFGNAEHHKEHGLKDLSGEGFKGRKAWINKEHIKLNPSNLGNVKIYGNVDKIITSPPFGGQVQHKTNYLGKEKGESGFEYSNDPNNLGNLPHGKIDKILSSPPYEKVIKDHGKSDRATKINIEKKNYSSWAYGNNEEQIGNLKGKTYLSEMLKIYRQCYKVLKDPIDWCNCK